MSRAMRMLGGGAAIAALSLMSTCAPVPDALQRTVQQGVLHVAALNGAYGCYEGPVGTEGFDCELLQGLAQQLGVRLDIRYYQNIPDVVAAVRRGDAAIGVGDLPIGVADNEVRYGPVLRRVRQQLVYLGNPAGSGSAPQSLAELKGRLSASQVTLSQIAGQLPAHGLQVQASMDDGEALLAQVASGKSDYAVVSAAVLNSSQRDYPNLQAAFDLAQRQPVGWVLSRHGSAELQARVKAYVAAVGADELARLSDRYFGHFGKLESSDVSQFATDVQARLPRYRGLFEHAAQRYGIDWRMVAVVGYQESHWDPTAVSRTGVRGLMMLTTDTAQQVGIDDRDNPIQSVNGAARYLHDIYANLPDSIRDPDRSWMALAAYNIGLGHVMDARELVSARGGDPDRWLDVRDTLPLLSRQAWYSRTAHGYARGTETVAFVGNIRQYFDLLTSMTADPSRSAPVWTAVLAANDPSSTSRTVAGAAARLTR